MLWRQLDECQSLADHLHAVLVLRRAAGGGRSEHVVEEAEFYFLPYHQGLIEAELPPRLAQVFLFAEEHGGDDTRIGHFSFHMFLAHELRAVHGGRLNGERTSRGESQPSDGCVT